MIRRAFPFLVMRVKPVRRWLLLLLLALASGCGKLPLYSGLSEQESNEMMALLLENGIEVDKAVEKEGVTLSIPADKAPLAVNLLYSNGYPRQQYTNVNEVFSDSGLVTTDFERKARFNFALSQEISDTLSRIDGVIFAKVHLSSLEEDGKKRTLPGQQAEEGKISAAVFVKYNPEYNLDGEIPQIKLLVSSSVNNLEYQDVSVSLSPARRKNVVDILAREDLRTVSGLNVRIEAGSLPRFHLVAGVVALVFVLLVACIIVLLRRIQQGKAGGGADGQSQAGN